MSIRELTNDDLLELLPLYTSMVLSLDKEVNVFGAINTLVHEIATKEDFIAIGLFRKTELIGFMTGYCFAKKLFHFSGIYVKVKNNSGLKTLIEFCLDLIRDKGYSAWSSNATNSNISSIMQKYGAKAVYTRFRGDL